MSYVLSARSSLAYLSVVLLTFLAASSAPTPLYHVYQEAWQFSPGMLTMVFGVYALSLLAALLTVGSLSDYIGRRPVLRVALLLNMLSMLAFIYARDVSWLLAARVVQGFATGMATSSLGAALLDNDRNKGPLLNSLAPLLGMALGGLGSGLLVQYAPWPTGLVYAVVLGVLVVQAVLLVWLPESVSAQPGALASLRPRLSVPPQARAAVWRMLPVNTAVWMTGGFFLSLAPSLVRAATGSTSNLIGGALVATLTLSGAGAIYALRTVAAEKVLRLGTVLLAIGIGLVLLAANQQALTLFFVGAVIAGAGFGSGFLGSARSVLPLAHAHERAGLMSTFYVLSYLAFCAPAILAGFLVRSIGLVATSDGYGMLQIALCVVALVGMWLRRGVRAISA
ncbi:MFS transporter [Pseudomonas eucalypticola]|uniref:MFS transporter n=1 Tax=Pseudomonas eucalypticola TaxID=2599595 RepID=A0A7D5H9F7_9PSED|nr:MFS transporter [Pseudomonas eucalypticola]QKZ06364.1 MFS transporter [Pseudomonas eucalypticola]